MNDIFSFWGCGNGVLKLLRPHIRILSGILIGCSCLLVPLQSITGLLFISIITLLWCVLAAMPVRMLVQCIIVSFFLFFPFVLLTPWMTVDPSSPSPMIDRFALAGAIALKSTYCFLISASTIAILAIRDVHQGIAHIPMPRAIVLLIVQLINQAMLLLDETMRVTNLLRLRGASELRNIRLLFSFPVVWMVRILFRAERTATAMMVRGYGAGHAVPGKTKLSVADLITVYCASAVFILSLLLGLRIIP